MMKRFLFLALICFQYAKSQVAIPKSKHPFVVIAHRGDHILAPENTLKAFQNAIKNNVDYVEIDLRTTKDSQLVVMHDENLKRMTGIDANVSDLTLGEIKRLNVIDRMHQEWGSFRIPTFEDVLRLCKGKINIYLDFKKASVEKAFELILLHNMDKSIVVYINTPMQFKAWRSVAPDMPLMVSLPQMIRSIDDLKIFIESERPDILDGGFEDYSPEMIRVVKKYGIPVWPDIQSESEDKNWDRALQLGVNGLQTDHPLSLIRYLREKKII